MPRRSKASAAVNPPMPPPTTMTFFGLVMAHSRLDADRLWAVGRSSLGFHAGGLDHRGPARNFRRDKDGKILRRANPGLKAELLQACYQFGRSKGIVGQVIELFHDLRGRCGRRPE